MALRKRMARRPAKSIGGGMRLIAGAARDLYAQVLRGRFDDDLFFGLRVFPIDIPPVRERQHDVQALAAVFWERLRGSRAKLSPPLLQALEQYRWPGNGRELKAVLSRLYHLFGDRPHAQQMALLLKETGTSAGADSGLPLQCLQHLARVAEAVRAVSLSFVPLLARKAPPLAELRALKPRIEPHKQELAALMRYPLLFHDESVFTMLSDLEQRLVRLDELLGAPVPERAPTMWQSAGEPFTQRLQRALAREADLVRREMG